MSFSIILILVIIILLLLHLRLRYSYAGRLLSRIPGPKSWPIIGTTFSVLKSSEELFAFTRTLFREHRNICKLEAFGIGIVEIFNPDDVEILYSTTKFNSKQEPYTFLKPWLHDGLLLSNGQKWQQRRKLLTPAFNFSMLKKYTQTFNNRTEDFLAKLKDIEKEKIDLLPLISNTTLNIMCETSMGTSLDEKIEAVANRYINAIQTFGKTYAYRIARIWLQFDYLFKFTKVFAIQHEAVSYLHEFTTQVIQERKVFLDQEKSPKSSQNNEENGIKSFVNMLDLLIINEKKANLNLEGIREEVDTFMFEGHDTTTLALYYFIMRIANEPEIQKRLLEEMQDIFGDSERSPTIDDLNEMKYLDCCIKESLRLYPSVPLIARYTTEDVTLSGYKVPAGTQCHINVFDMHRREDCFPEPEKFIPERFLPENCTKRHPYSYMAFSVGPRNCIGQKFAMLEMKTVMSGLIRKFKIQPVTTLDDIIFKTDIVLRTKKPLYVQLISREK